ncbi:MAG: ClpP family protease [Candidatus Saccharimonadaceae bacterium]
MFQRTIVEERSKNVVIMDVFSKLAQERIIFIDDVIDDSLANGVIAQLLYLDSVGHDQIDVYINSPGGSVYDGFAIYDVSKLIKSPIRTVCVGMAASMAAVLMFMGKERCGTQHSRIMFHQPSGRASGTSEEIQISHEEIQKVKKELYEIVEQHTTLTGVEQLFRLDTWYTAKEAIECGILTCIL